MITTTIFFLYLTDTLNIHTHTQNMHVYVCTNRLAIKYCLYLHVYTWLYFNNSSWKNFHAIILRLAFFFFICYIIVFGVVLNIQNATVNSRVFLDTWAVVLEVWCLDYYIQWWRWTFEALFQTN